MKRALRRLFGLEIEILGGLLAGKAPGRSWKALAPPLPGARVSRRPPRGEPGEAPARAPEPAIGRPAARPGTWGKVLSMGVSVSAHLALLAILAKTPFFLGEPEAEERGIQVVMRLKRAPPPPESRSSTQGERPQAQVAPAPPPPLESPPLAGLLEPRSEPRAAEIAPPEPADDPSADDPGAPGTGEAARAEPEGRPGPPGVIGVGSSPPPGDGTGRGGDGEGEGFGSRSRGRGAALKRYGGSGGTEDAVSRGLRWLAAHQDGSGGWLAAGFARRCHHFTQCPGKGLEEFDVGVTALCALAFLGAGQAPGPHGAYGRNLERALESIIGSQRSDGAIGARGQRYLYNHALGSFALFEAYAMTRERRYLNPALSALRFSAASQQEGGGWDYSETPTGRNDLSITGWQVMALRAALAAGLGVPEETLRRVRGFLRRSVTAPGEAVYADRGVGAGRKGINMTAVALLSRLYLGTPLDDPWVDTAADRILRHPPDAEKLYDWDRHFQSSYYWYAATLALFHLGGQRWEAWNHFLKKEVLRLQSLAVHEEGSWAPEGNWLGAMGGRVFTTAMNVLTLEVYYRYPPLHSYAK